MHVIFNMKKKCIVLKNKNCDELEKEVTDFLNRENVSFIQFTSNNNLFTCFIVYQTKENKSKKKES